MIGILGPYSPFLVGGSGLSFRGEGPPPLAPPMPTYGLDTWGGGGVS